VQFLPAGEREDGPVSSGATGSGSISVSFSPTRAANWLRNMRLLLSPPGTETAHQNLYIPNRVYCSGSEAKNSPFVYP
jgi:hypothetical protein